jgi:hypothetical protein
MELVRAKGMFSFYEDGHQECCRVRKVRRRGGGGQGVNAVCRHSCLMSVTEQESAQAAKPGMPTPNGRVCAGVRMR